MKHSDSIIKISAALCKAQKNIGAAERGSINPFFKSNYADLGSVMQACKDALNDAGLTVLQPIDSDSEGVYVETIIMHESGEFISSRHRINQKQEHDPQAQGSAITYARRYSLQSLLFIPAEDDDGNKANGQTHQKPMQAQPQRPATQQAQTSNNQSGAFVVGIIEDVDVKQGVDKNNKPYTKYGIKINGLFYGTFSETIGLNAQSLIGSEVKCTYTESGKFKNAVDIELIGIAEMEPQFAEEPLPF